jgi:hypothetical protein
MGRKPIGVRALTSGERYQRWLDRKLAAARGGACPECERLRLRVEVLMAEVDSLKAAPPHSITTE